jgi:2-alkyl-3-oxoalkanoate reductase
MKILVTGATGYMGSNFIKYLLGAKQRNDEITVLLRSDRLHFESHGVLVITGDLTSLRQDDFRDHTFDVVLHFAALMADKDDLSAQEFERVNVDGTKNLILATLKCKIKQFILISTVGVYGATTKVPVKEETRYGDQLSPYETSKVGAEVISDEICHNFNIPLTILRLGLMYGEGMTYGWPNVVDSIRKRQMRIIGDGKPLIQLSYIRDIIEGINLAIGNQRAFGSNFNLSGDDVCSISEVFNSIADILKMPHPRKVPFCLIYLLSHGLVYLPKFLKSNKLQLITPHRVGFFRDNHVYSIEKAKKTLNFSPQYDIKSGMQHMINVGVGYS